MTAGLIRANSIALPLRDDSVDLVVTSPPYYSLRSYQDGGEHYDGQIGSEASPAAFLAALWAVTDELWRTLKPGGSVFVNLGDKYAGSGGHNNNGIGASTLGHHKGGGGPHAERMRPIEAARRNAPDRYNQSAEVRAKSRMLLPHRYALGCVDPDYRQYAASFTSGQQGPQWICRSDMVWSKPNGLPESVTDRVRASHEYWFHLVKSPTYYANLDALREPSKYPDDNRFERGTQKYDGTATAFINSPPNPLGKLPGSVWTIPTEPLTVPDWLDVDHYAAFPSEWPRRLILGWSPPGICTACGEGRRATVDNTPEYEAFRQEHGMGDWATDEARALGVNRAARGRPSGASIAAVSGKQITGERCACPTPNAPTRPAIVADPFGGTGTVAMIARALGRYGVNVDLSADYLRLARWRIHDSGHWDKAVERTTGRRCDSPTVIPGQMSLL